MRPIPALSPANTVVGFRAGATLTFEKERATLHFGLGRAVHLRVGSDAIRGAMEDVARGESSLDVLMARVAARGGGTDIVRFGLILRRLAIAGTLSYAVHAGDRALCVVECLAAADEAVHEPPPTFGRLKLSRFAFMRHDAGSLIVESPLAHVRVRLIDDSAWRLLWGLRVERSAEELLAACPERERTAIETVLALLVGARIVEGTEEERATTSWEFHDLLFHSRTRMGRTTARFGATDRFAGRFAPLPLVRERDASDGQEIALPRVDVDRLRDADVPFSRVLEDRASLRAYGAPLALEQLGEFLYRSCRLKESARVDGEEVGYRMAPSGGGRHEIDVYVIARECAGLRSGLHRYDPRAHSLVERSVPHANDLEDLLDDAKTMMRADAAPQVLLVLCARFPRMMRKYESIAYSLILKNAGALIQTMYLVATAMALAPCALGAGDADRFARAAGIRYLAETSVGEFALGTRRARERENA